MASYKKLPIYRKAYELASYIEQCSCNFSRQYKYTSGTELRLMARKLLRKIARINRIKPESKPEYCKQLLSIVDDLEIELTLCLDLKVFKSQKSWYHAAELLHDISSQCSKLENYFEGKKQNSEGIVPSEAS